MVNVLALFITLNNVLALLLLFKKLNPIFFPPPILWPCVGEKECLSEMKGYYLSPSPGEALVASKAVF